MNVTFINVYVLSGRPTVLVVGLSLYTYMYISEGNLHLTPSFSYYILCMYVASMMYNIMFMHNINDTLNSNSKLKHTDYVNRLII